MSVDVRLEGGPRNGYEGNVEDENQLAVLFPGYTPVKAESDPVRGLIMLAQWAGDEVQAASYDGVLNVVQENSAYEHPDDQGAPTEETDQTPAADAEQGQATEHEQVGQGSDQAPEGESQQAPAGEQPSSEVTAGQAANEAPQQ